MRHHASDDWGKYRRNLTTERYVTGPSNYRFEAGISATLMKAVGVYLLTT